MKLTRAALNLTAVTIAATSLAACSSSGSGAEGEFCTELLKDTNTSAGVFNVVAIGQTDAANIDNRLALLDKITTMPDELEDDMTIWKDYLKEAKDNLDNVSELLAAYDAEAEQASDALLKEYTGNCL